LKLRAGEIVPTLLQHCVVVLLDHLHLAFDCA
jgi:hypothetical protein